jgi:hypothetical protein
MMSLVGCSGEEFEGICAARLPHAEKKIKRRRTGSTRGSRGPPQSRNLEPAARRSPNLGSGPKLSRRVEIETLPRRKPISLPCANSQEVK